MAPTNAGLKYGLAGALAWCLAGCAVDRSPAIIVPPKPEAFSATSSKPAGEQVGAIYQYCSALASQKCPGISIYCRAYRPEFVKSCLLEGNVPPGYIVALIDR